MNSKFCPIDYPLAIIPLILGFALGILFTILIYNSILYPRNRR